MGEVPEPGEGTLILDGLEADLKIGHVGKEINFHLSQ